MNLLETAHTILQKPAHKFNVESSSPLGSHLDQSSLMIKSYTKTYTNHKSRDKNNYFEASHQVRCNHRGVYYLTLPFLSVGPLELAILELGWEQQKLRLLVL